MSFCFEELVTKESSIIFRAAIFTYNLIDFINFELNFLFKFSKYWILNFEEIFWSSLWASSIWWFTVISKRCQHSFIVSKSHLVLKFSYIIRMLLNLILNYLNFFIQLLDLQWDTLIVWNLLFQKRNLILQQSVILFFGGRWPSAWRFRICNNAFYNDRIVVGDTFEFS